MSHPSLPDRVPAPFGELDSVLGGWLARLSIVTLLAIWMVIPSGCRDLAPPPDTLRLAVASAPEALDPRFASSAVAMRLSRLVFAPLLVTGDNLVPAPYLAESIVRIDDVTYELVLRSGLTFHDGSPITTADVAYTFGSLGDADVRSPHATRFSRILRIETVSDLAMRFVLDKPFAAFPLELCAIGVVPAACRNRTEACRTSLVGSGPFAIEGFDPSAETLALRRHEGFALGAAGVARVEVRVVRDGTTRLLELIDGKTDLVIGDIAPAQLDAVRNQSQLRVQQSPGLAYTYLAMNLRPPKAGDDPETAATRRALADPRVREAISHALDVDRVIKTKLRGSATRASGMLPAGHWAKDPALQPPAYDPDRARALLDEAGFPDRGEGGGGRFRVVLSTTTDRLRRSLAIIWAHQLEAVGLDVTVRVGEWATLYEDIKRGNFEMFSALWVPVEEPDLMHWVFHSENIPGPDKAGGNRGAFVDPEVDAWLDAGRSALDPEARAPFYQQVEKRLSTSLPYVPLWFDDAVAVHHERVTGFVLDRQQSFLGIAAVRLASPSASSGAVP